MKKKEKIVGSITILILSIVFLCTGYFISKDSGNINEDIFVESNYNSSVETFKGSSKNENKDYSKNSVNENNKQILVDNSKESSKQNKKSIIVDIKGEVKFPKEYNLNEDARIRDLINQAGGLTKEADVNSIHFSQRLKDEDCIVIYKKGEVPKVDSGAIVNNPTKTSSSEDSRASAKVNINNATLEELKTLQGIGDTKAQAIIQYREENGGFKSVEELTSIKGIGEKTLNKFIDKVDIR